MLAQDAKEGITGMHDLPLVVGNKNINKFTPHIAQIRTGALATWTDLSTIYRYIACQPPNYKIGLAVDDRTFEDASIIAQDYRLI